MVPPKYFSTEQIKSKRREIDALIQFIRDEQKHGEEAELTSTAEEHELYSMASYQALVHLIDAKMWLGKMLEGKGNEFPAELADKAEAR